MLMTNETRAELARLSGSVGELRLICNALRERIEVVERRVDGHQKVLEEVPGHPGVRRMIPPLEFDDTDSLTQEFEAWDALSDETERLITIRPKAESEWTQCAVCGKAMMVYVDRCLHCGGEVEQPEGS